MKSSRFTLIGATLRLKACLSRFAMPSRSYPTESESLFGARPSKALLAVCCCHTLVPITEPKPPYVCPECSNHTYDQQYGQQIQYLVKLQAKILTNDPWVRKKITWQCDILSIGADSTSTTEGETCLVFIF
jgi:hypothetical protein